MDRSLIKKRRKGFLALLMAVQLSFAAFLGGVTADHFNVAQRCWGSGIKDVTWDSTFKQCYAYDKGGTNIKYPDVNPTIVSDINNKPIIWRATFYDGDTNIDVTRTINFSTPIVKTNISSTGNPQTLLDNSGDITSNKRDDSDGEKGSDVTVVLQYRLEGPENVDWTTIANNIKATKAGSYTVHYRLYNETESAVLYLGNNVTELGAFNVTISETTYDVVYDPNGGTVTPTTGTVKAGEKIANMPTPERTDYDFVGWTVKGKDGSWNKDSDTVTEDNATNGTVTFTAQWRKKGDPVNPQPTPGGDTPSTSGGYTSGSSNTDSSISNNPGLYNNYLFYLNNNNGSSSNSDSSSSSKKEVSLKVSYDRNIKGVWIDGVFVKNGSSISFEEGDPITIKSTPKKDYIFKTMKLGSKSLLAKAPRGVCETEIEDDGVLNITAEKANGATQTWISSKGGKANISYTNYKGKAINKRISGTSVCKVGRGTTATLKFKQSKGRKPVVKVNGHAVRKFVINIKGQTQSISVSR